MKNTLRKTLWLTATMTMIGNGVVPITGFAKNLAIPVEERNQTRLSIDTWMPNRLLQKTVLKSLNAQGVGKTWHTVDDISQKDMALLTELESPDRPDEFRIDGKSSYSLQGLEYAVNLETANLYQTQNKWMFGDITDVSPLAGLTKLKVLELGGQRIKNVAPLAGLKNLQRLSLVGNEIMDFSSIASLQNIPDLVITGQRILLDSINVNANTKSHDWVSSAKMPDGTPMRVAPMKQLGMMMAFEDSGAVIYRQFIAGGEAKPIDGGARFTDLKAQETLQAGDALFGGIMLGAGKEDKYAMILALGTPDGKTKMGYMVQPYKLANEAAKITVQYVDQDGRELIDPQELTGLVGDGYHSEQRSFEGYTFDHVEGEPDGTFRTDEQSVKYVYHKDLPGSEGNTGGSDGEGNPGSEGNSGGEEVPSTKSKVTVRYQDELGRSLLDDVTLTGSVGEPYQTEEFPLTGYHLKEIKGKQNGVFESVEQEVIYIYAKDQAASVTVRYLDQDGRQLAPDRTLLGQLGAKYQADAKVFPGYKLKAQPQNSQGQFLQESQTVTFWYEKIMEEASDGDGDQSLPDLTPPVVTPMPGVTSPVTGGAGDNLSETPSVALPTSNAALPADQTGTTELPQTNEAQHGGIVLGITLLGAAVLSWFLSRKHR